MGWTTKRDGGKVALGNPLMIPVPEVLMVGMTIKIEKDNMTDFPHLIPHWAEPHQGSTSL